MKTKLIMQAEIKEITPEGVFEGMLSPYGNLDETGDVVEPGAYKKTLKDNNNEVVCLWQHDAKNPIGKLTLEDRADGLWCKGQLEMALPKAREAYICIKGQLVKGLSIGFQSIQDSIKDGVRHLKEIKLYEGSLVTFPANLGALIASVKNRTKENKDDFNEELTDVQLMDAGYQMFSALRSSLGSLTWDSEMSREDKIAAAEVYIKQFSDAYLAYFPLFLDMLAEYYGGMEMMAAKLALETKAGRRNSEADTKSIKSALDHASNIQTILSALVNDGAGDEGTPKGAAEPTTQAEQAAETKSEPVEDHSAISSLLTQFKETLNGTNRTTAN